MMSGGGRDGTAALPLLASRLAYQFRCLREDAMDPEMTSLERLALVRDRTARIRESREELKAHDVRTL
jgi:hypothetical protein